MPLRLKARELIWMTLPVLVIASVVWWKIYRTNTDIVDAPPDSLSQGSIALTPTRGKQPVSPLKLVLAPWKQQQPSPADGATGHTIKWGTRFWVAGKVRGKLRNLYPANLTSALTLQYRQGSKWRVVQLPGGWNGLRVWVGEGELSRRIDLALPMNLVPDNADEVRLRGYLQAMIFERVKFDTTHKMQSSPIDLLITKKGDAASLPQVNRQCPLEIETLTTQLLGDAANNEPEKRINARLGAKLRWNHPTWQREKPTGFTTQQVQLLDENGHDWLRHANPQMDRVGCDNLGHVDGFTHSSSVTPDWGAEVRTSHIPASAGELRLRALVSPEWKNGYADWPVQIESIVRPKWLTLTPPDLKVQKVSLAMERSEFTPHDLKPVLSVELSYTSPRPLFARGKSEEACGAVGKPSWLCWEENDQATAQIPFGEYIYPKHMHEAKPGENELIVSWSQRLEDKLKPSVVSNSRGDITVLEPNINGDHVTAKYELKAAMNTLRPQTFLADIGLRNQGMVPIRVELTPGENGQPQIAR